DAGSAQYTTWSASPAVLRSGETASLIIAVNDLFGNDVSTGSESLSDLSLTLLSGDGTGTFGTLTELGGGLFASSFTGIRAGKVMLQLALRGIPVASGIEVEVTPGVADHLTVSGVPKSSEAGVPLKLSLEAKDANENTLLGNEDGVEFASNDPSATLPEKPSLQAGSGTFTIVPRTSGTLDLKIAAGTLPPREFEILIEAGPVRSLELSGYPDTVEVGQKMLIHVRALDEFSNPVGKSADPVQIQSDPEGADFPSEITLASGEADLPVSFNDAGTYIFRFTLSTLSVSSNPVTVIVPPPALDSSAYLVRIASPVSDSCTGVLIHSGSGSGSGPVIVTSAHCVWNVPLETIRIAHKAWGEALAESVTLHEAYNPESGAYDLALIALPSKLEGKIESLSLDPTVKPAAPGEVLQSFALMPKFTDSKATVLEADSLDKIKGSDPATQFVTLDERAEKMSGGAVFRNDAESGLVPMGLISKPLQAYELILDLNSLPIRNWIVAHTQGNSESTPAPLALIQSSQGGCIAATVLAPSGNIWILADRRCAKILTLKDSAIYLNAVGTDGILLDSSNWIPTRPLQFIPEPEQQLFLAIQVDAAAEAFDMKGLSSPVEPDGTPLDGAQEGTLQSMSLGTGAGTSTLSTLRINRAVASKESSTALAGSSITGTLSILQSRLQNLEEAKELWGDSLIPGLTFGVYNPAPGCSARSAILYVEPSDPGEQRLLMGLKLAGPETCETDSNDLYLNLSNYREFLFSL
ncbi:MAG: hypothetical protein EBX52_10840, partial [Proteobacteria bacterium]|nr:hypothetical protein [Pseudomonadota bacterium]